MIIHNPILTGSFTVNGTDVASITSSAASITAINSYTASQNILNGTYATTGSNTFAGIQTVNSNLVVTGSITAQTLVVQTVTSSVIYSSGSNVFGNNIANTQVFTGSMSLTGSLTVVTTGTELQVTSTGVRIGNVSTDTHPITGSVNVSGSAAFSGSVTSNGVLVAGLANGNIRLKGSTDGFLGVGESNGILYLADWATAAKGLQINLSTGAATFSSSVGTTALNMNNMSALGSISGGSIYLPSTAVINFRSADGSTGYGSISGDTSSNLILNNKVGIGMTPDVNLQVKAISGNNSTFRIGPSASGFEINQDNGGFTVCTIKNMYGSTSNSAELSLQSGFITFGTGTSYTERMRITSGGNLCVATTSVIDVGGVTGVSNMLNPTNDGKWALALQNNATTNSYGRGLGIRNITDFNNASNEFLYLIGNTTPRFYILSNGGVYNYSANNSNLSDARTKKDIIPLESYWDKFKAIEIVKFKYKDQTHDDYNIGVIAQQVLEVAPEFVNEEGFGGNEHTPEDGIPLKSIYSEDLHHTTIKVLQEAMAKIETLEAQITELKNK